jgi:hypothetical protein
MVDVPAAVEPRAISECVKVQRCWVFGKVDQELKVSSRYDDDYEMIVMSSFMQGVRCRYTLTADEAGEALSGTGHGQRLVSGRCSAVRLP